MDKNQQQEKLTKKRFVRPENYLYELMNKKRLNIFQRIMVQDMAYYAFSKKEGEPKAQRNYNEDFRKFSEGFTFPSDKQGWGIFKRTYQEYFASRIT